MSKTFRGDPVLSRRAWYREVQMVQGLSLKIHSYSFSVNSFHLKASFSSSSSRRGPALALGDHQQGVVVAGASDFEKILCKGERGLPFDVLVLGFGVVLLQIEQFSEKPPGWSAPRGCRSGCGPGARPSRTGSPRPCWHTPRNAAADCSKRCFCPIRGGLQRYKSCFVGSPAAWIPHGRSDGWRRGGRRKRAGRRRPRRDRRSRSRRS